MLVISVDKTPYHREIYAISMSPCTYTESNINMPMHEEFVVYYVVDVDRWEGNKRGKKEKEERKGGTGIYEGKIWR